MTATTKVTWNALPSVEVEFQFIDCDLCDGEGCDACIEGKRPTRASIERAKVQLRGYVTVCDQVLRTFEALPARMQGAERDWYVEEWARIMRRDEESKRAEDDMIGDVAIVISTGKTSTQGRGTQPLYFLTASRGKPFPDDDVRRGVLMGTHHVPEDEEKGPGYYERIVSSCIDLALLALPEHVVDVKRARVLLVEKLESVERVEAGITRARHDEVERTRLIEKEPKIRKKRKRHCTQVGCRRDIYVTDEKGKGWCKRHGYERKLLERPKFDRSEGEDDGSGS